MIDETLTVDPLENQYANDKNHAVNWLQTPPSQMPWGVPLANQPTIMRFTGDSCLPIPNPIGYTNPAFDIEPNTFMYSEITPRKRKVHMMGKYEEPRPAKQLITEEKMVANLDSLHISNNYVAHQCGTMNLNELPGNTSAQQNTSENHLPTLVLCDELRRLTAEAVIPPAVIAKLERPTNALVLWKPPAGTLGARLQQIVDACKGTSNQDNSKSSSWASFTSNNNNNNNNNNNYPSCTEDMNDPDSDKERQDSRNTVPEDSLMEI